jgi:hypothetical protein
MNTNSSHPPKPSQEKGYNPITLDDVTNSSQSSLQHYFGELRDPVTRCVAAPLLFFIFTFTREDPVLAPLTLLILLGCLFARFDNYQRQIAAVPLTLAAIKVAAQMALYLTSPVATASFEKGSSMNPGFVWLPMFYSACLVFIPRRDSVTFKIVLASSCVLLASGLLPGQAFVGIFYLLNGTLFVAMIAGIFVDLKSYALPTQVRGSVGAAQ